MSLSKERQEYHLTPSGWIPGTFYRDNGGRDEVPIPADRVLTMVFVDETVRTGAATFDSVCRDYVGWESDDKTAIRRLQKKFGNKPEGYK